MRLRPLRPSADGTQAWQAQENAVLRILDGRGQCVSFGFDQVFSGDCGTGSVYQGCAKPLLDEALQGKHCTLFAYGQTGEEDGEGAGRAALLAGGSNLPH